MKSLENRTVGIDPRSRRIPTPIPTHFRMRDDKIQRVWLGWFVKNVRISRSESLRETSFTSRARVARVRIWSDDRRVITVARLLAYCSRRGGDLCSRET